MSEDKEKELENKDIERKDVEIKLEPLVVGADAGAFK